MAPVQIALLGGFQARLASGQPLNLPQKLQALLAYLALSPGQAHPRDKLATLLWTEATHERARQSLRQALATLRQAVPPVFLLQKGEAIALDPAKVTIDVTAFELAVADGSPDALERAAALYRGDLLAGLGAQPVPFEEWLLAERERLRELAIETVATLLAHHVKTGPIEQAIKTALRLLSLDPGAESAHRTLMRLYAQQGRRGSALRQYQICVTALERELGVEPDQETRALYQDLLRAGSVRSTGAVAAEADTALRRPGLVRFGLEAATSGIPLVGRQAELAVLREAFQPAWTGHGVTAVIQGEAGIGKSRLVETLVTDALDAGCQVLLGRAFETQQILPFGPWVEAFRSGEVVTELLARDDFDPIVRADLARLFPELGPPGRKLVSLDYVRLFEAMSQVVRGLAARQPLLLVLEDLHWADEMSVRLLAFLSRRLPAWPVIIVGTVRTEELIGNPVLRRCLDELSREPRFLYTALAALSRSETTGLVRRLARAGLDESAAGRLAERIWQVSEGNAFMVVETMRGAQDREEREMAGPLPMPARIRELISTRLTRVTDRGLQLVQAASAIGREFDFALLAQAAGLEPEKAAEGVEELVARRILHVVGERLDFTHDRIREVAYAELLAPRRRLLHARVGKTLEALYAQELEPHYLALGLHYRSAEEWERAFVYLAQAGQSAAARSAHRDAVTSFELALDAARRLPSTREVLQRGIDVRFDLRNSLLLLWQPDRIAAYVREAERLARTLDDRPRLARASAYLSHYFWRTGRSSEALVHARQALAFAEALGDLPLRVAANLSLGLASHTAGELQETEAWLGRVIDALPGHLARERLGQHAYPAVNASAHLICALAERGEFDRATRTGEETLRLAEELDHPLSVIYAYWSLAFVHGVRGESSVAANLLERALTVADRWDITDWRPIVTATLGDVYVRSGRVPDGLTLLREALSAMRSAGLQVFQSWVLVHLGDACLLANRIAEATELADQALTFARDRGERGFEAAALRLLGDIAATVDPCEAGRAEDQYRRATERAEALGMRPLAAQCRLRLGVLRVRCEQSNAGLREIAAACDQFAALGMASSLERAEAELARCASISSPAGGAQQQPLPGQRKERL